jgi:hypothetical protein
MTDDTLAVPQEDRCLVIVPDEWTIVVPPEWRSIRVTETMIIASKRHTEGDTKRWTINYDSWLDNAAVIEDIDVQSDSTTCTIEDVSKSGPDVIFFLTGGTLNERLTVSLTMTDSFGNIKHDTIKFTVIAA